ncbi:MAG: DNA mismatch endonuclease Vsr [Candidatus Aenigmarchaeota archaeon]|nr:DNA mismatch endonuclease Vsr [Candidatus Aenigmarchaeota archaeon]
MGKLTPEQRSYCMSRIRSKWTKQETKVHNWLKGHKIKHVMHPKICGNPDVILKESNTVIFIHGCFWHKCQKCYKKPKSNREYWFPKIEKNVKRDKENIKHLKSKGYKIIILWEHEIKKDIGSVLKKIFV